MAMTAMNNKVARDANGAEPGGSANRPHVVVLGAGFGGLSFAKRFPDGLARVTVVDRANHHLFQPLLYQVAAAGLAVPDIAQPIRSILAPKRDVTVLMDEVTSIEPNAQRVGLRSRWLNYDYLVVALGGRTSYFGHPEWERCAPGLKSAGDALRIRRDLLQALERAEQTSDPTERKRLLTTVVIGGGPAGVELAGAFAESQRHVLASDFRRANTTTGRVILVEAGSRLLAGFPAKLAEKAERQLQELGVMVWLGGRVTDIREGEVVIGETTLAAGNIIWAAGVAGSPLVAALGAPTDRGGRAIVQPDLSVPGHPEVFVIGDNAAVVDTHGRSVPGISPAAIQMGSYAARTIAEEVCHGSPRARPAFRYRDKGTMATIGRSRAVARIGRLEFSGSFAWLLWLGVHLLFLIGFRNKVSVLVQWAHSYITYKPGARVIYAAPSSPAVAPLSFERPSPSAHFLP